jgi:hypothetical protein
VWSTCFYLVSESTSFYLQQVIKWSRIDRIRSGVHLESALPNAMHRLHFNIGINSGFDLVPLDLGCTILGSRWLLEVAMLATSS